MCVTVTYRIIHGTTVSDVINTDVKAGKGESVEISFEGGYIHLSRDPEDGTWEIGANEGAYIEKIECKEC